MKKLSIIACSVGLAFVVATVFAADKKQPTLAEANATIQELNKQIVSLQAKTKDMEQRLAKLEKAPGSFIGMLPSALPAPTIVIPRPMRQPDAIENNFADPNHPPKIWGEGQINGWKFYTIPISATEGGTAELIPVAGK